MIFARECAYKLDSKDVHVMISA